MTRILVALAFVISLSVTAATLVNITTRDGTIYKHVEVIGVERDAIRIMHATGVARLPFSELPAALQKQYRRAAESASPNAKVTPTPSAEARPDPNATAESSQPTTSQRARLSDASPSYSTQYETSERAPSGNARSSDFESFISTALGVFLLVGFIVVVVVAAANWRTLKLVFRVAKLIHRLFFS